MKQWRRWYAEASISKAIWLKTKDPRSPMLLPYIVANLDDDGRMEYHPESTLAQVCPLGGKMGITPEVLHTVILDLVSAGLLIIYESRNETFLSAVPSKWAERQQVRRDTYKASKLPAPPARNEVVTGPSRVRTPDQIRPDQKRKEKEGEREGAGVDNPPPPAPPTALPSPSLGALAPQGKPKLPWAHCIPWFEQLWQFTSIKGWEEFASKILDECLTTRGMTWPDLQEKLLDSAAYAEEQPTKYKPGLRIRKFYWDQVQNFKHIAPADPEPGRRHTVSDEHSSWPPGATRFQNGQYFDPQGNVVSPHRTTQTQTPNRVGALVNQVLNKSP